VGYDDDGVKTSQFTIIDQGIFRNYQTTREQAHLVGDKESHGCSRRIPGPPCLPADAQCLAEGRTRRCDARKPDRRNRRRVLIDGRGSYSIDQQRYNFQFGGDAFWEIKGGKKGGMISRVAYQGRTPDFWQACDGTAVPRTGGVRTTGDAKGEPTQINSISMDVRQPGFTRSTFWSRINLLTLTTMFTKDEAQKLGRRSSGFSTFPECQVTVTSVEQAYTRFANNGITNRVALHAPQRFGDGDAGWPHGPVCGGRS